MARNRTGSYSKLQAKLVAPLFIASKNSFGCRQSHLSMNPLFEFCLFLTVHDWITFLYWCDQLLYTSTPYGTIEKYDFKTIFVFFALLLPYSMVIFVLHIPSHYLQPWILWVRYQLWELSFSSLKLSYSVAPNPALVEQAIHFIRFACLSQTAPSMEFIQVVL